MRTAKAKVYDADEAVRYADVIRPYLDDADMMTQLSPNERRIIALADEVVRLRTKGSS